MLMVHAFYLPEATLVYLNPFHPDGIQQVGRYKRIDPFVDKTIGILYYCIDKFINF